MVTAVKIFAIPELLEMILSHLGLKELHTVQRVCKEWRDLIDDSKPLRRIMFYDPTPHTSERFKKDWNLPSGRGVPPYFELDSAGPLATREIHCCLPYNPDAQISSIKLMKGLGDFLNHLRSRPAVKWKQAFVAQPPTSRMLLVVQRSKGGYGSAPSVPKVIEDSAGIRLGLLTTVYEKLVEEHMRLREDNQAAESRKSEIVVTALVLDAVPKDASGVELARQRKRRQSSHETESAST